MIPPIQTQAPAAPPVTLEEVKRHIVIDHDDDMLLLTGYIEGAVNFLDGYGGHLGRCIVNQNWDQNYSTWSARLTLPFPDVSAVVITYLDDQAAEQTVAVADYELFEEECGAVIRFRSGFEYPSLQTDAAFPITVSMTAGFGDANATPKAIKVAIQALVSHWYDNRSIGGKDDQLPFHFHTLVDRFRRLPL